MTTEDIKVETELIQKINENHPVKLLTHLVDDDESIVMLVKDLLALNGMINIDAWHDAVEYKKAMLADPLILPNICLFDFLFDDRSIDGLGLTIMTLTRNPRAKVIMITGYKDFDACNDFYWTGGFKWINKDLPNFKNILIKVVQSAIESIKLEMKARGVIDEVDIPKLRTDRQPLANNGITE